MMTMVYIVVDNAIGQVQKDLSLLSNKLKSADQLDSAIDIAKRVRTVKKLLFPTDSSDHLSLTSFTLSSASAERQVSHHHHHHLLLILSSLSPLPLPLPIIILILLIIILILLII